MVGDSFIFIPNLNEHESNYLGYFPNSNFNKFPEGTKFIDFYKNRKEGQFKDLKGGYLDINIFKRWKNCSISKSYKYNFYKRFKIHQNFINY